MGVIQKLNPEKRFKILGDIVALFLQSRIHQKYTLKDIRELVVPPVDLNQFRIYEISKLVFRKYFIECSLRSALRYFL